MVISTDDILIEPSLVLSACSSVNDVCRSKLNFLKLYLSIIILFPSRKGNAMCL